MATTRTAWANPRTRAPAATRDVELAGVSKLARVLDHFMVDPLIGLFAPGAGDLVGSVLGLYTVVLAARRRMSPVVIARMLLNLALDALFGIVPVIGDLFDLGFRANQRNVKLLEERAGTGGKATARDWLMVAGAAVVFLGALALALYAVTTVVRWIF